MQLSQNHNRPTLQPTTARYLQFLSALALLFVLPLSFAEGRKTSYSKYVLIDYEFVPFHDGRLVLGADLTGGDFFEGLTKRETRNGLEFRKGTALVDSYPPAIQVQVRAWISGYRGMRKDALVPDQLVGVLSSLRFDLRWKRGIYQRTAHITKIEMQPPQVPNWGQERNGCIEST